MRKLMFTLLTCCTLPVWAQVSSYTFTKETGQPWEISQYPSADSIEHVILNNLVIPGRIRIPFPFEFNKTTQDSVNISENGFIWFGEPSNRTGAFSAPLTDYFAAGVTGVIAAMGADLHPRLCNNVTELTSAVVGTAPMRELIIQWKNTSRIEPIIQNAPPDTITFQIKLYEFMNRVEVAYLHCGLNKNISTNVQVGLRGTSGVDFNSRRTNEANATWQNTLPGTTNSSGTANVGYCELNANKAPAYGDLFVWMDLNSGMPEADLVTTMKLQPNPATSSVAIGFKQPVSGNISVHDLTGKTVLEHSLYTAMETSINVASLNRGMYLVVFTGNNGTRTVHKLTLQ